MARWEYIEWENRTPLRRAALNALGAEGWELVGFTTISEARTFHYVFKRAL